MISSPIIDDSITRFPKNQKMEKESRRCFLARQMAVIIRQTMMAAETSVVAGLNRESDNSNSCSKDNLDGFGYNKRLM